MTWSALEPDEEMDEDRSLSDQSARQATRIDGLKIQICKISEPQTRVAHKQTCPAAFLVLEDQAVGAVCAGQLEKVGRDVQRQGRRGRAEKSARTDWPRRTWSRARAAPSRT